MASHDRPTPLDSEVPGGWPLRGPSYADEGSHYESAGTTHHRQTEDSPTNIQIFSAGGASGVLRPESRDQVHPEVTHGRGIEEPASPVSASSGEDEKDLESRGSDTKYSPVKSAEERPLRLSERPGKRELTDEDLIRHLSRRITGNGEDGDLSRATTEADAEEQAEINRLMSRMFGRTRQEHSEEEKTRHVGVVFKHLTVRGMGLGAALQPTFGDPFLALPRLIGGLFTRGRKTVGKPPIKTIINDFSGVIRPGEMCLVLGRPGSGCSTFLKVIGNQRFGYESIDGDVMYGGTDAKTMLKKYRGEVLYNPEDDLHYATLSVQSTLRFALQCKTPGQESRNQGESAAAYVNNFLQAVVKLFWIEHTLGTKVGNEYVRGVSGGEKKRVSIAEAMITKASTQCWDNSTRGLDASTALEYVSALRSLTNMAQISTAVALYQAGENLYRQFDKVLLIDGGRCAYYGSADEAVTYFKELGFLQPPRWTSADFLTSVTDPHERHVKEGWERRIPRTADELGDMFLKSEQHQRNLEEIADFEREARAQIEEREQQQGKATKRKNYTIPFHRQVWACTKRQFLVMVGDKQSLGGKWGGILFQALIVGSLFYDLQPTSSGVFPRGGVLFFMLLFNALLALAELTAAFESRPILLKHKSFQFYRPAAFAIAQTVVDVPLVLVQVLIFDIVVYFMSNLARTASQFFISLLLLFLLTMTMYAFFRAIGALSGSLDGAARITGVAIQALIVYTGYLIPPSKMHPWFSWLRWINPIQYGFECLMSNEFYNLEIQCVSPNLVPVGPGATPEHQGCTIQGSTPGSAVVQGAEYIQVAYQYSRSHLWRNVGFICAFFVFFVALTAFGMEIQKPNKGGGAVTIYKRGQAPKSVESAMQSGGETDDVEKNTPYTATDAVPSDADSSNEKLERDRSSSEGVETVAKNETVFTWQKVNYTIPYQGNERKLLQDVQGYVRPGKLTALMGASGAGKTTLLNTLAQRITFGRVEGDFLVDGRPLPRSFQRCAGFAEQMDVHESTATVREALRFSAKLRQPREVPLREKYEYCETILQLLEMENIAGATIGTVGSGLNQEQRKRLTIGVELASKPELLMFLDEPTSGLDSGAAFNIVRFLRKLADAGQAILCTIHQPSAVLFEQFDELILLKSGGRVVYHGELGNDSRRMLDYFEGNGAKKCPPQANPAEYMLEAIGSGNPDYNGPDWGDTWAASAEKQARTEEIQSMSEQRRNAPVSDNLKDQREYAMPIWTQVSSTTYRNFVAYWRSPEYLIGKFMLHIFTGLFNTFTFWHLGNSQIDMQSRLFSIFMTLTISPPLIQQLQPRFLNLRNIYQSRERNSKIYSWVAFTTAAVVPELPWSFLAGTMYWCCWYWATWFPRGTSASASMWLFIALFEVYYVSFGQAIASFAPNELLASILVPLFFLFVVSFCGVVVPYAGLPYFWRSWMYWLTPFHYLLEGMLALVTHGIPVRCDASELAQFSPPAGQTCDAYAGAYANRTGGYVTSLEDGRCGFCQYATGDAFAATFNAFSAHVWRDYGIFWGFCIFNFVVVFLASYLYLGGGRKLLRGLKRKQ
ncbi:ABC drug exporter [Lecanosticta acicola]|uniref:ABC drug exporter n=1 Tax=Lecanosticta acicola TaxID=111012 RepID=A0AAI8YWQ6_9PEZI|nr:ABC drug exporter [Lecanosticta acicola]